MATNTQLPALHSLQLTKRETGGEGSQGGDHGRTNKKSKVMSFLSRVQLGSLRQAPLPGDVHHAPAQHSKQARPLGLIPSRDDRLSALKRLNQLLSPWPLLEDQHHRHHLVKITSGEGPLPPPSLVTGPGDTETIISANIYLTKPAANSTRPPSEAALTYRLPHTHTTTKGEGEGEEEEDPDYMETVNKEYCSLPARPAHLGAVLPRRHLHEKPHPSSSHHSRTRHKQTVDKKGGKLQSHFHAPVHRKQYVNFTEQTKLFHRDFTEDKRDGADYEPCERCRVRGGRCARCKAIRTGGGYIILDENQQDSGHSNRKRRSYEFGWSGPSHVSDSGGEGRRLTTDGDGSVEYDGGGGDGNDGGGNRGTDRDYILKGGGGRGEGGGGVYSDLRGGGEGGRKEGGRDDILYGGTTGHTLSEKRESEGGGGGGGDRAGSARDGMSTSTSRGRADAGSAIAPRAKGERQESDHSDVEESGRQSHTSRSGSRLARSRPGSTLGTRPGSSMRKSGGRGQLDGNRNRASGGVDLEKRSGRGSRQGGEGEDDNNKNRHGKRGRGLVQDQDEDTDEVDGQRRSKFRSEEEEEEEEEDRPGYHGNLIKFQRKKRDNVKALQATLKELQGIDPLDYLAKYCIIDQAKVPHYQHVYSNVDRDEDDEIDIGELDFALKAVNYNLISDTEMNFVHSVLELAGRYKLNFRLFSLIAALSEKVVSLEDMVKRLIDKMDFDALEVKMKKCKELFYLLADSDVMLEHEGGVVTTSSLGVELQAGGLTQEHLEFVVDRLNNGGRGLVEFLDYLTYVPLFVEIHDSISGNPFDFTRTK